MNAGPLALVNLMSASNQRMVIPVYQRPYSWDEEQCEQLWDGILRIGETAAPSTHFTGSVVWIQDGTMSANGVTPLLLIDGQQRVTTLSLLFVALAEYARDHGDDRQRQPLRFSYDEIIDRGYLVDKYRDGEDHWRLTLSQGDKDTFRSIVAHLQDPGIAIVEDSRRLIDNLAWFRGHIEALSDPNIVWDGIRRLEVVSISLAQGQDNPQLIFESMNSTGKDLSTADLVRNYVLMGLPIKEQAALYEHQWRSIEQALGANSYDQVFDDFIRDWLTVVNAPAPLTSRDMYRVFKRHVADNGFDDDEGKKSLLREMLRYAHYYARIISANEANEPDTQIRSMLQRIHALRMSVVDPLLMSFLSLADAPDSPLSHGDLLSMLRTLESYLFRRMVCDMPSNGLNKFFPSLIARLNAVQEDGGNVREAFEAMLLGESGTSREFPDDGRFRMALSTRDCYSARWCKYLLALLENSAHPKEAIDVISGTYTIEHVMPQNALNSSSWKAMLGGDCQEVYDTWLHRLGNLTLTGYNSELSDASFEEKKHRALASTPLSLSQDFRDLTEWNETGMRNRSDRLTEAALSVWERPDLDASVVESYKSRRSESTQKTNVTFNMLLSAGYLHSGDVLEAASDQYPAKAIITDGGQIQLKSNGETFNSPSGAAVRVVGLTGRRRSKQRNGWMFWRVGDRLLADIRASYVADHGGVEHLDRVAFRNLFWDGFFDHCSQGRPDFVECYGDPSGKEDNKSSWVAFGIGISNCNPSALLGIRDHYVAVEFYCNDAESYEPLLQRQDEIDELLQPLEETPQWDARDVNKKSRHLLVTRHTDLSVDQWPLLYDWLADGLVLMTKVGRMVKA